MTTYTVAVTVRVDDKKKLYAAALKHLIEVDRMSRIAAIDLLRPLGKIDYSACLQIIIDPGYIPGCDVIQSRVEIDSSFTM